MSSRNKFHSLSYNYEQEINTRAKPRRHRWRSKRRHFRFKWQHRWPSLVLTSGMAFITIISDALCGHPCRSFKVLGEGKLCPFMRHLKQSKLCLIRSMPQHDNLKKKTLRFFQLYNNMQCFFLPKLAFFRLLAFCWDLLQIKSKKR